MQVRPIIFLIIIQALLMAKPAAAEIVFTNPKQAYKTKLNQERLTAYFAFENRGEQMVTITKMRSTCGCTTAELAKKSYAPGEKGQIKVNFDLRGRFGEQRRKIYVKTDDGNRYTLRLKVIIPEFVSVKPRVLSWDHDEPLAEKEIRFEVIGSEPVEITSFSGIPETWGRELITVEKGKTYILRLKPTELGSGEQFSIRLETNYKTDSENLVLKSFVHLKSPPGFMDLLREHKITVGWILAGLAIWICLHLHLQVRAGSKRNRDSADLIVVNCDALPSLDGFNQGAWVILHGAENNINLLKKNCQDEGFDLEKIYTLDQLDDRSIASHARTLSKENELKSLMLVAAWPQLLRLAYLYKSYGFEDVRLYGVRARKECRQTLKELFRFYLTLFACAFRPLK